MSPAMWYDAPPVEAKDFMSDKPETQDESKGAVRKRAPSFDDIMQGVTEEKSAPPPAPKKAPEPKKSAQPTFEEILEKAAPEPSRPPQPERKSRPPRQKEERKMPIVVRKPTLGAPASQPPAPDAAASEPTAGEKPSEPRAPKADAPLAESV